ncbi:MAG TPA: 30S ribosomal protein S6e [Candidatus Bathyarchaeota archaeon]|nr:30S ribosomal protein S6e [Candidatus Bathyarchaeota archaeon]
MAKFKIIVSDPETGKSQLVEVEESQAVPLIGRKLGEVIDGAAVKLSGYKLKITGGSDKDGFPMRPDIHGGVRVGAIISEGVGFRPSQSGKRKRKTLRGNVITDAIVQINMKIVEKPKKSKKEEKPKAEEAKEESAPTEETAKTS